MGLEVRCLVLLFLFSIIRGEFAPICDLHHKTDNGFRTPHQLLPLPPVASDWLYAGSDEILKAYEAGMKQCEKRLAESVHFTEEHAAYYVDINRIPFAGQKLCRGTSLLYDLTGMLVWPFGPVDSCPTYSKCWFGLLTCGSPKLDKIRSETKAEIDKGLKVLNLTGIVPTMKKWTIQSLHLRTRVVGPEIVVPEARHFVVKEDRDAFILQYQLTRPGTYKIETRQLEFYPAMLMKFPVDLPDLLNIGRVFLGGSEARCKPWTRCNILNNCCGCDEKSIIQSAQSLVLTSTDGSDRCPNLRSLTIPLCPAMQSSHPGRWILSSNANMSPSCLPHHHYSINNIASSSVSTHSDIWLEASGNPCIHVAHNHVEDMNSSAWFYAPYTCKYHFYSRAELHKCFADKAIHHMHFQGDSMSRDLFTVVSQYLGVTMANEAHMKKLTNTMKKTDIKFHRGELLLSEGYSWDWNEEVMRLVERPPVPDVLIINHAIAHRVTYPALFELKLNETERMYWEVTRNQSMPLPKYRIFQNARDLHGYRTPGFVGGNFRQDSTILKKMYEKMGFGELDEFLLTSGRVDASAGADGWHFFGSTRHMDAVVLFNMLCNDWLSEKRDKSMNS